MSKHSNDAVMGSRAEQRRMRLLEAEVEQQREELEALKITEEQLHILRQPFMNVKFEFFDLDGLYNPTHSFYTRQYRSPVAAPSWNSPCATSPSVLTKSDLARFTNSEETIRIPQQKYRYPSVLPTGWAAQNRQSDENLTSPPPMPTVTVSVTTTQSTCSTPTPTPMPAPLSPMRELDLNLNARPYINEYPATELHSPDIQYDDMFQDNSAYYNSCPPSPCPTPTRSFRYLPSL